METNSLNIDEKLLLLCYDDHVGLWFASLPVNDEFPQQSSEQNLELTLGSIQRLLEAGLIEAGFPTADGRGFTPWQLSVSETMTRIREECALLGGEPDIGDVVWFQTTERGEIVAKRLLAETNGKQARQHRLPACPERQGKPAGGKTKKPDRPR